MEGSSQIFSAQIENVLFHFRLHDESFMQRSKDLSGENSEYHVDHSHVFYEVFYSNGDNNRIKFDDSEICLDKHSFAVVKPFVRHSTFFTGDELFSIGFSFEKSRTAIGERDLFKKTTEILSGIDENVCYRDEGMLDLFKQLRGFNSSKDIMSDGCTLSVFIMIIFNILILLSCEPEEECEDHKSKDGGAPLTFRGVNFDTMEKIGGILNSDYMEDITPESLSKQYFISPKQINRYFINQYGQTFLRRRAQLRMNAARTLLENTDMTILEISEKVGYNSINTFYSSFKLLFGMTPDRFRKLQQTKSDAD